MFPFAMLKKIFHCTSIHLKPPYCTRQCKFIDNKTLSLMAKIGGTLPCDKTVYYNGT